MWLTVEFSANSRFSLERRMGHKTCCVVNCRNNEKNSSCKFYTFPKSSWKLEQRKKWIAAVKRKNADGSNWSPKPYDTICSAHFIGGKKSEEQASPSYIPTIFPTIYGTKKISESQIVARYNRFKARRSTEIALTMLNQPLTRTVIERNSAQISMVDQGCQVEMYCDCCDAEIQVEIAT